MFFCGSRLVKGKKEYREIKELFQGHIASKKNEVSLLALGCWIKPRTKVVISFFVES